MPSPTEILAAALAAPLKDTLSESKEAIVALREKNYTWREIAQFLQDQGVDTDHSKVYRFMQRYGSSSEEFDATFKVPSAAEYEAALRTLELSPEQRVMLGFHYHAHNRTATFTQLAKAAGKSSYRFANTTYGGLGRKLGEELRMNFAQTNGTPFYSSALGIGNPFQNDKDHFQLVMHHELAKALASLGWFNS
jgi:hypothetical protein